MFSTQNPTVLALLAPCFFVVMNSMTRLSGQSDAFLCVIIVNLVSVTLVIMYHALLRGKPLELAIAVLLLVVIMGYCRLYAEAWTFAGLAMLLVAGCVNGPGTVAAMSLVTTRSLEVSRYPVISPGCSVALMTIAGILVFKEVITLTKVTGAIGVIVSIYLLSL